jgi:radical SAM protein with 4Fe4S-binding SPASM domain
LSASAGRYRRSTVAVWEITLRCNLACSHCGSRAGAARESELDTAEALDLVSQLADAGIREVSLIGGEAYLRPDWLEIAAAVADAGMACSMVTGGYGLSAQTARRMAAARMRHVSVSVDGLEATHDRLRGRPGSFAAALAALGHVRDAGILVGCNTQLNRLTAPDIPRLYRRLRDAGIGAWQLQLTVPSGHAADRPAALLQPCELPDLYEMLARVARRAMADGVRMMPGNNIGYHGPYDGLLQGASGASLGLGCPAGLSVLGIEADGVIKGCPSLPASSYAGGNVRTTPLRRMLAESDALAFNIGGGTGHLWGFCRTCRHAPTCRGGCTWTAHAFFDRPGNNPYCHHRALELARRGLRERVTLSRSAPGLPFDNGVFDLIEEPLDAAWPEPDPLRFTAERVAWPEDWTDPGPWVLAARRLERRVSG